MLEVLQRVIDEQFELARASTADSASGQNQSGRQAPSSDPFGGLLLHQQASATIKSSPKLQQHQGADPFRSVFKGGASTLTSRVNQFSREPIDEAGGHHEAYSNNSSACPTPQLATRSVASRDLPQKVQVPTEVTDQLGTLEHTSSRPSSKPSSVGGSLQVTPVVSPAGGADSVGGDLFGTLACPPLVSAVSKKARAARSFPTSASSQTATSGDVVYLAYPQQLVSTTPEACHEDSKDKCMNDSGSQDVLSSEGLAEKKTKATICRHWTSKGWCRMEEGCKFQHPEALRGNLEGGCGTSLGSEAANGSTAADAASGPSSKKLPRRSGRNKPRVQAVAVGPLVTGTAAFSGGNTS
jgi:hypothetical protein